MCTCIDDVLAVLQDDKNLVSGMQRVGYGSAIQKVLAMKAQHQCKFPSTEEMDAVFSNLKTSPLEVFRERKT